MNHPGVRLCAMLLALLAATSSVAGAAAAAAPPAATAVDCTAAYAGARSVCQTVTCPGAYLELLGTWSGQFQAYVRELSKPGSPVFRPYEDTVTYDAADCLNNGERAESLIVGHRRDRYPSFQQLASKEDDGLLIMVTRADGTRLLRTVDHGQFTEFVLSYSNPVADVSIWSARLAAGADRPQMTFTTIDARDFEATAAPTRRVVVTMTVGPDSQPLWSGVIAHGTHARRP